MTPSHCRLPLLALLPFFFFFFFLPLFCSPSDLSVGSRPPRNSPTTSPISSLPFLPRLCRIGTPCRRLLHRASFLTFTPPSSPSSFIVTATASTTVTPLPFSPSLLCLSAAAVIVARQKPPHLPCPRPPPLPSSTSAVPKKKCRRHLLHRRLPSLLPSSEPLSLLPSPSTQEGLGCRTSPLASSPPSLLLLLRRDPVAAAIPCRSHCLHPSSQASSPSSSAVAASLLPSPSFAAAAIHRRLDFNNLSQIQIDGLSTIYV